VNKTKSEIHGASQKSIYGCLLVIFFMVIITLTEPLMGWVWVLCGCAIIIATVRIKQNLPNVKNITLNLFTIFCMALLIYLSSSFGLMATMVNLLVVAACLKLINLQNRADYYLVLIVLFFLIACGFIYHQSIYFVVYYFACITVLFLTAFLLNKGNLNLPDSVKQSTKMMLQALPITLVLFIVTPRLAPFWTSNIPSNTQTGLSEEITPGDIANLAQSADLVFRAEFDSNLPTPEERYWRSIVLDYFDGNTWKITKAYTPYEPNIAPLLQTSKTSTPLPVDYRYLVIAQANNTKWLYSLNIPIVEKNMGALDIYVNRQYQLFQSDKTNNLSLYIVRSFIQVPMHNFVPEIDFVRYLQTPLETNQRTQLWVSDNIKSDMSFTEKLAILNGHFIDNPFIYTLKPPLMPSSPVDAFLFDNQQGFCSHYASALTYMLRLAGVPARMVAGYQGGEEQGDNILTVRQFDAHAWVEAYDKDKGWVRFDPTALVAPNRTLAGLLSALNAQEKAFFQNGIEGLFNIALFDSLHEALGIIDHNWSQFVLEFNNNSQSTLIEDVLGELSKKNLVTFLLISFAFIGLFLVAVFLPYRKWLTFKRHSVLQKVLALLGKKGASRYQYESLQQFYNRVESTLSPDMKDLLASFIDQYYAYEYSADSLVSENELLDVYSKMAALK
jgi:transglutaminase-like putative cysteine protease